MTQFYQFISTLPRHDVAGILCACGYSLRESLSLFKGLYEMGFCIDTGDLEDIEDEQEIAAIASFCLDQLKTMDSKKSNAGACLQTSPALDIHTC